MDNNKNDIQEWARNLINQFQKDWKDKINHDFYGFAVFYSPVFKNPKLLIVGDNPGGSEHDNFNTIPVEHEYLEKDYPLAKKMREKIFQGDKLREVLEKSVKTNRIFFRTPDSETFNQHPEAKELEEHCKERLEEIIDTLQPEFILAESFGTFGHLSPQKRESILKHEHKSIDLLIKGAYKGFLVYGIQHPSSARGISNDDWKKVNEKLGEIFSPKTLQESLIKTWEGIEKVYHEGVICSERHLQAELFRLLKNDAQLPDHCQIFVAPKIYQENKNNDLQGLIPDLVFVDQENHRITGIMELEYKPHGYPEFEKNINNLAAFYRNRHEQNEIYLETNPKNGDYNYDVPYFIDKELLIAYGVIANGHSDAITDYENIWARKGVEHYLQLIGAVRQEPAFDEIISRSSK